MSAATSTATTEVESPTGKKNAIAPPWLTKRMIVCIGIVLLAHLPLLILLAQYQWSRPHYQCFPVVLAGFAYFVYTRWKAINPMPIPKPSRISSLMLIASLILLLGGVVLFSPWLAGLAMILAMGSLLMLATGRHFRGEFFGPWALLWLIVPLPMQLDIRFIGWLQTKTSVAAGTVLDLMGIRHYMSGNVLEFPGTLMMVEEACSGIHSLFALIACVGLFVVWARRPIWHSLALLLSAAFWAALTNFLRVLLVAVAFARFDIDLATGWIHDAVGVVFFCFALLMLVSTDQLLMSTWPIFDLTWLPFLGSTEAQRERHRRKLRQQQRLAEQERAETGGQITGTPWKSLIVAGMFAFLALLQLTEFAFATAKHLGVAKQEATVGESVFRLEEQSLPQTHNDWNRVAYEFSERSATNSFGPNSKTWKYESPICNVAVSLDYPFTEWHELSYCYGGHGWNLRSRRTSEAAGWTTPEDEFPFVELVLTKPTGEYGYVLFSIIDERGGAVPPPDPSLRSTLKNRILEGPLARVFGRESKIRLGSKTYQIQVFASADRGLDESERETIRNQFVAFAKLIRQRKESGDG